MGLGVHIRVDAEAIPAQSCRQHRAPGQYFKLRLGFDIKTSIPAVQRVVHFARLLADAGKDDLVGRDAGGESAAHFAFGHDVGARAEASQRLQDGQIGIGLERVSDERLHSANAAKDLEMPFYRRGGIAIERRSDRLGDVGNADALGMKNAVFIVEMVHVRA